MAIAWSSPWLSVIDDPPEEPFFAAKDEVLIIAIDADDRILLLEEPSPAFGETTLILPGGAVETDEDVFHTAQRELREETGFMAGQLSPIAKLRPWAKYLKLSSHIVFATELSPAPLPPDETHELVIHRKTRRETRMLIETGELCDARVIAALTLSPWWTPDIPSPF